MGPLLRAAPARDLVSSLPHLTAPCMSLLTAVPLTLDAWDPNIPSTPRTRAFSLTMPVLSNSTNTDQLCMVRHRPPHSFQLAPRDRTNVPGPSHPIRSTPWPLLGRTFLASPHLRLRLHQIVHVSLQPPQRVTCPPSSLSAFSQLPLKSLTLKASSS